MTPGLSTEQLYQRWEQLKNIQGVEYNIMAPSDITHYEALPDDYDAWIGIYISKGILTETLFKKHPRLKYIATTSHGFEEFDKAMTQRYGVTITNTIYGDFTIAQYAMALLLETCHHVSMHHQYLKEDYFTKPNQRYTVALNRQIELCGKTVGVLGLGAIGFRFAQMAHGFGARIISYDQYPKKGSQYDFIEQVSLEEMLQRSDIISIHCPLTKDTYQIINQQTISQMKDGVILINTARGKLIDEAALLEGLNHGKIYAAGLDVLAQEPPQQKSALIDHPHCIVTGHIAWLTAESRLRGIDLAIENLKNYLDGQPTSVINR